MKKYSRIDDLTALGVWVNAMDGGGDKGCSFPRSDAEDLSRGLQFIPGEVTMARRRGERVEFYQSCSNKCCWYWQFANGSRTYYWEQGDFEAIARMNGREKDSTGRYVRGVGACLVCGNTHTNGDYVKEE